MFMFTVAFVAGVWSDNVRCRCYADGFKCAVGPSAEEADGCLGVFWVRIRLERWRDVAAVATGFKKKPIKQRVAALGEHIQGE